ncbi:hypothetical protein [Pararhizobium gei]|uniref:hypothetical protein n=1 Tax=Pararhizobium gei TaxID=1395951 RepID=UPI0023DC4397|nr:hypothetical protein [Rhizobium gei]
MRSFDQSGAIPAGTSSANKSTFHPLTTLKCDGPAVFRSQTARDLACLLDIDKAVLSWRCQPLGQDGRTEQRGPDFLVNHVDGTRRYLDAPDRKASKAISVDRLDNDYLQISHDEIYNGFRLQNARDLLRYGAWRTSLGDRVRILAALDEHGILTLAECLGAIQESRPVAAIASLILSGFLEVDLDDALLGPETMVRRIRP